MPIENTNPEVNPPSKPRRIRVGEHVTLYRVPKSPFWYMSYALHGKQPCKTLRTSNLKVARALALKKDAELVLGVAKPESRTCPPLAEILTRYLQVKKGEGVRPDSLVQYERDNRLFVRYLEEMHHIRRIEQLTPDVFQSYCHELETNGYLPPETRSGPKARKQRPNGHTTICNKLKTNKVLVNWAVGWYRLPTNPLASFKLPKRAKKLGKPFEAAHLAALLNYAVEEYRDLWRIFAWTGLRNSELCWLLKSDVMFDPPQLTIRAKICPQTGFEWKPKHDHERVVPLPPEAVEIARKRHDASPGPWLFYGSGPVRSKRPGHYTPHRLLAALVTACKTLGIPRGKVHAFRHSYCSFLANNGVNPFKVMKLLGHGSLDIVLVYYAVNDSELQAATNNVPFGAMLNLVNKEGKEAQVAQNQQTPEATPKQE